MMALTGCNVSFFFLGFTKHYFGVWESMGWSFGGFWQDYAKYISPCFLDTGLIYIQLDAVIRSIHFTILQQNPSFYW